LLGGVEERLLLGFPLAGEGFLGGLEDGAELGGAVLDCRWVGHCEHLKSLGKVVSGGQVAGIRTQSPFGWDAPVSLVGVGEGAVS